MAVYMAINAYIVARGVAAGIETAGKILMPFTSMCCLYLLQSEALQSQVQAQD